MGEIPVGGWFFEMTFGRTVDFLGVGMRDYIKIEMTIPTQYFSMYRIFVGAILHVKKAHTPILIYPPQTRVLVTDETGLLIVRIQVLR
jgi:hypothetical protein